jgi:hypothetical protein
MFFPLDIVWRWGIKLAFHEILLACLVDAGRARVRPANRSPEVRPDGRVTFRLKASGAKEVQLRCEGVRNSAMQKDGQGVSGRSPPIRLSRTSTPIHSTWTVCA